jgi:cell wall-associated NlpC family hydrolase
MSTHLSRPHRKAATLLLATLLQVGMPGTSWSAETPANAPPSPFSDITTPAAPVSSTAFSALQKLHDLRDRAANLTEKAIDLLGIRYKRGGNTPENGLDCSGFVRYVFKDAWGADLPRTAAEISKVGEKVDPNDLKPGDLVFYNTLKRGFSHVGIYLGDNKFIHSPAAGGQVRIESMDIAYWKKRFNGARRVEDEQAKLEEKDGKDKK